MSTTKYRVYYSTEINGPWTLANSTLIENDTNGNSYEIVGLSPDVEYYAKIVGGVLDSSGEFLPQVNQVIGPINQDALGIESDKQTIKFRTFQPNVKAFGTVSLSFTVV